MRDSLRGKVVLVTGAGRGIGRAIAVRFAGAGSAVAVNDIDGDAAAAAARGITDSGGAAMAVQADVSDSAPVGAMIDAVMAEHGRIDVLVNNAGIVSPTLHFFEADEQWWRRIIDVNLTGHFLVSHPAARIMAKQGGGSIINMSSGGATRAHRSFTAYDATKGGIEALTRAMALDLGPYNIRVNALVPGSIDTTGMSDEARRLRGENVPLGRIGEPADMTGAALFLASDEAAYITGTTLRVDGGMLAQQRSATVDIVPPSASRPSRTFERGLVAVAAPRIGVDVGGTFTDVALENGDGTFSSIKVLTTHDRPEEAILAGVSALAARNGVAIGDVSQIIHGTTLATNALIERRGAPTALVTTAGFRDVIETRTESRFEQYDLNIVLPAPLIERKDRFVVPERVGARGQVLLPLDEQAARRVVAALVDGGYESVAVGFMHSYRNGDHERRFRDLVLEAVPSAAVSLSCEVSPQMREFERFNTVCANAYVQPPIASYLRRLESELRRMGAVCPLLLIHSGGGLMSIDAAASFPVRLVESGPAGGAIFAAHLARAHRRDRIVSYDMGGTTAKIALIEDCSPRTAKTFETAEPPASRRAAECRSRSRPSR